MNDLVQRLREKATATQIGRLIDIEVIVAEALEESLQEVPVVSSQQLGLALFQLFNEGVLPKHLAPHRSDLQIPSGNKYLKGKGVQYMTLHDAIQSALQETNNPDITIHYGSREEQSKMHLSAVIYYIDEATMKAFIFSNLGIKKERGKTYYSINSAAFG